MDSFQIDECHEANLGSNSHQFVFHQSRMEYLNMLLLCHPAPILVILRIEGKLHFQTFVNFAVQVFFVAQQFLASDFKGIFVAIYRLHGIDDNHEQVIHILLILDNKIHLSVGQLESDTLP